MGKIDVKNLGKLGVNVDKNPLELDVNELRKAQNAVHDPRGTGSGIKKRAGLYVFNIDAGSGPVRGGITTPILDELSGFSTLFLGRGGEAP